MPPTDCSHVSWQRGRVWALRCVGFHDRHVCLVYICIWPIAVGTAHLDALLRSTQIHELAEFVITSYIHISSDKFSCTIHVISVIVVAYCRDIDYFLFEISISLRFICTQTVTAPLSLSLSLTRPLLPYSSPCTIVLLFPYVTKC